MTKFVRMLMFVRRFRKIVVVFLNEMGLKINKSNYCFIPNSYSHRNTSKNEFKDKLTTDASTHAMLFRLHN